MDINKLKMMKLSRRANELRNSPSVRKSAANALFSVAEYVAQPLSMVVAAPFLVHHMGLEQFGIWVLVSAILGSVGILSTGFGDATVKYVSAYRGQNNAAGVKRTIRATLTVNGCLGTTFALLIWSAAPFAAHKLFKIDPTFYLPTVQAIRISAVILVIRSVESVFVSTQKAFEQYGPAVKLNIFLRIAVVLSAVAMAALGRGIVSIMWATLWWSALIVVFQAIAARRVAGKFNVFPTFQAEALREVSAFGCFSWLQSLAGVVMNYGDRFLLAALLGPVPLAIYVVCAQVTQPIHSMLVAGFNFMFPHLSARDGAGDIQGTSRIFRVALAWNAVFAVILSLPVIFAAKRLLLFWMGRDFADKGSTVLIILAVSYAALGSSVVPHFGLLALGRVRLVAALNIMAGVGLIVVMSLLVPAFHLVGAALGRLFYCCSLAVPYWMASQRAFRPEPNPRTPRRRSIEGFVDQTEPSVECTR